MTRRKAAALAIVAAAAISISVAVLYAALAPDVRPPGGNGPGTPPPPQKASLSVLSSPATFPFAERWASQYNNGNNMGTVQLVYSSDADDANIPVLYSNVSQFLSDHSVDLAIAGRPAQGGEFTYEGSVFLPVSPQAIAIVYNVPGFPDVPSGMKFDATTLHAVLSGNATHWNDPRIIELNPDLNLPAEPIVVVHERRAGSALELLEKYMNSTVTWPEASVTAESADALATVVRQTPFSIGYVDFSGAVQTRMTYAALQNSDGEYILPSPDSIGMAVKNGTVIDATVNGTVQTPPTVAVGQLGNGSYPVVGFYYVALTGGPSPERAAAALDFARWVSGESGQRLLGDVQYPSIYEQREELRALADALAADVQAPRFENATNLTGNPNDSVYGQIAAEGDNVYVVWEESVAGRNYDIFVKTSRDAGSTFGPAANISRNDGFSEHPQVAVSGNNVYAAWADDTSGKREILFAKSASAENAFGRAVTLSGAGDSSYNAEIAAFGDSVYVVWQERTETIDVVVFRASSDGGNTFGEPVVIAESADPEAYPKVAAYEDAVHVVWASPGQPALHYVRSDDGGATFSTVRQLNGGQAVGEAQVAAYGDNVYVVWGGLASQQMSRPLYVASADGGATFAEPAEIGDGLVNPMNVELAIMPAQQGHFVHVAVQVEASPGNEEIVLVSGTSAGAFAQPVNLSNNEGISECPSIAVSGNNIFVVWEDRTVGNNEIFFARGSVS